MALRVDIQSLLQKVAIFISYNGLGINEGGMVNGVPSRKVGITLNSAVSLV